MAIQPQQQTHWRDRLIARSEAISDAWEVAKAYAARVAEWILYGCLFANILEMFPLNFPGWFGDAVLAVQALTLDVAGFGLTTMADHARRSGNEKAAKTANLMGWALISLMILTVGLVTLSVLIPSTKDTVSSAEKALLLVRVIVTVLYGHVVHSLRQASIEYANEVSTLRDEVSTLQPQLESARQQVDTLRGHLREKEQEVDTLRGHLSTAQHQVSTLQGELDSGQSGLSTLRKQLTEAQVEAEALHAQLEGKKQELAGLREQLENSHEWHESRVRQMLEAEQQRVSMLQQQLDAEVAGTATLRQQLTGAQQEVSTLRQQLKQQRVSSSQKQVDGGQYRVSTGRAKVDSGHPVDVDSGQEGVDSGQGKVVRLDTSRSRKNGLDDHELAERIQEVILQEPELSDRAIATRLQCSPTTVGRKRRAMGKVQNEGPDECVNE